MLNPNLNGVILFFPGPMGGAEKVVLTGMSEIQKNNLRLKLWIVKETRAPQAFEQFKNECDKRKIKYQVFECRSQFDLKLISLLKNNVKKNSINLIHAHGFKASFYSLFIKVANFIMTHHGITGHTLKVRIYEKLELLCFKKSNYLIGVSKEMEKKLARYKSKNITTIYNPLSLETKPTRKSSTKNESLRLLIIGRLSPEKAHSDLFKALKLVKDQNIQLDIIGDGVLKPSLEKEVELLKLNSRVCFHGFQDNITPFLNNADAVIMPSHTEGLPMVLIECCCFGMPILASKIGGIPELVKDGNNGLLFPVNAPAKMAFVIDQFQEKQELIQKNAINLIFESQKKFSANEWLIKHCEVYNSCFNQE